MGCLTSSISSATSSASVLFESFFPLRALQSAPSISGPLDHTFVSTNLFRQTVIAMFAPALFILIAVGLLAQSPFANGADRAIHGGVPATIDPAARYLFHLHGRAIEVQGPKAKTPWGNYLYNELLEAFGDRGFIIISEVRPATTQVEPHATMVAGQIAQLLSAGVPPENITVTGFSKGGAIAVLTTAIAANPRVNFVVMAGCLLV